MSNINFYEIMIHDSLIQSLANYEHIQRASSAIINYKLEFCFPKLNFEICMKK